MFVADNKHRESQEERRRYDEIGYPEHPRAGMTDDLETLYSLLHRYLGQVFKLKQFRLGLRLA